MKKRLHFFGRHFNFEINCNHNAFCASIYSDMRNENENILLQRILNGETDLFSHFVERYSNLIFSLIARVVISKEDAEEITQDVFLKAFQKLHTFNGKCSFSTWLYRIAHNSAVSATRKKKFIFVPTDESQITNVPDSAVDELLNREDDEELLQQLENALCKLNTEDRILITLFYYQDKSVIDISDILEITVENVKVKLYRVRKKLYVIINKTKL